MAQFDVHQGPARQRAVVPFYVVVQSARLNFVKTRVVVPLVASGIPGGAGNQVFPRFQINGQGVSLHPLQILTVPLAWLGPVVASLADDASRGLIINALDEVLSQAYG